MSIAVEDSANAVSGLEQYAVRAFAEALEAVPIALAENRCDVNAGVGFHRCGLLKWLCGDCCSGLQPIATLAALRAAQKATNNAHLGVDCMDAGARLSVACLVCFTHAFLPTHNRHKRHEGAACVRHVPWQEATDFACHSSDAYDLED